MPPLELALIAAKCLAGLAALYFGASWLVAAASDLARRLGVSPLLIGLTLGVAALIRPIEVRLRVLQWDLPVMLAATALLAWFAFDGVVGRAEGLVLLAGMFAYLGLNVQLGRRERRQGDFAGTTAVPPAG